MGRKHSTGKPLPKSRRSKIKNATLSPAEDAIARRLAKGEPFRSLVENLGVGVAVVTPIGDILFANRRFAETIGLLADAEIVGSNLRSFFSRSSSPDLQSALSQCCHEHMEGEMNVEAEGVTRVLHLAFDSLPGYGEPPVISLLATEVTELVEKRKALVETKASVHSLSGRILQLQDEERRRISRDLHDVVGQEIAVLAMSLSQLSRAAGTNDAHVRNGLEEALAQVRRIEEGVRTLSYLLHPPLLDELGLSSALHWYVDGFAKRSGIQVEKLIAAEAPRFGLDSETALFRVVQESLANVLRHSGSQTARVEFWVEDSEAHICIEDDGKGIPREKLRSAKEATAELGVGIAGMRQRLEQLGGSLTIRSRHPGTQVQAAVPAAAQTHGERSSEAASLDDASSQEQPSALRGGLCKRVLIADDHEVTRHGVRALFASQHDLEICGEAVNGMEAVQKAAELQPDIVLMDLAMPELNGMAAAMQIQRLHQRPKILVFTSHAYTGLDQLIRSAGLDGYILKSQGNQELLRAIRVVLSGGKFYRSTAVRAHQAS